MTPPLYKSSTVDYLYLVALALLWATSFTFIKIAVQDIPPFTMTLGRLWSAFLTMLVVYAGLVVCAGLNGKINAEPIFVRIKAQLLGLKLLFKKIWWLAMFSAITGNVLPFAFIAWSETHIDSGLAAVLMGVMPLSALLLAHFAFADEKLNSAKIIGTMCGFIGILVLVGYSALMGLGTEVAFQLLTALAAVSYAVNSVIMRHLSGYDKISASLIIMLFAGLLMAPLAVAKEGMPWQSFTQASWLSLFCVLSLGAIQTALATLLMFRIVSRCGAVFFSQINFLIPVFGMLFGVVFLAEAFRWNILLALLFILTGIAWARRGQAMSLAKISDENA